MPGCGQTVMSRIEVVAKSAPYEAAELSGAFRALDHELEDNKPAMARARDALERDRAKLLKAREALEADRAAMAKAVTHPFTNPDVTLRINVGGQMKEVKYALLTKYVRIHVMS